MIGYLSSASSTFVDDGTGYDLRAGDGIYTENVTRIRRDYHHGIPVGSVKNFLTEYVVSHEYVLLDDDEETFEPPVSRPISIRPGFSSVEPITNFGGIARITRDWAYGGNGCRAAQYGWCSDCCVIIDLTSCSVTVGW